MLKFKIHLYPTSYYPTLFFFFVINFSLFLKAKVVLTVFNVKLFPISAESAFIFALCYLFFEKF